MNNNQKNFAPPKPPVSVNDKNKNKSGKASKASIAGLSVFLCVVCFLGGIGAANLAGRNSSGSSQSRAKLDAVASLLEERWYYGKDIEDLDTMLYEQAIAGMTTFEQDPHTNYMTIDQSKLFSEKLSGSNVGLGITFYPDEQSRMVVRSVIVNSTADAAGLKPGDVIIQVDDLVCSETAQEDLISYIQSKDGGSIVLQVERDGQVMSVQVQPGTFDSTVSMSIDEEGQYGLITLTSFSEQSGRTFADAAARIKKSGVENLIIDLRDNSGGYVFAAQEIASTLLPEDSVVFIEETKDGTRTELTTTPSYAQIPFEHIYILQNDYSASASEVLIGTLKDNLGDEVVTTIGTTTYGKGTEQVSVPLGDETTLKYTIAQWLTPNGTSINNVGFTPDIEVEEREEKTVLYRQMDEGEVVEADSVSDLARPVQLFLQLLGYPVDRTDEYFSAQSSQALAMFQSDHGLEADGRINQSTLDALASAFTPAFYELGLQADNPLRTAVELASGSAS